MTTKRIDELTAATELTGDDLLPIMDGAATTKKITAANARPYLLPSAAEVLALLVTVDGPGSGLDADLLDGNSSAAFATAAQGALADTAVQPARSISTTAPLTGGGDLSANRTLAVSAASDTASGVVELATTAETQTGTDTARAVTPAGAAATFAALSHSHAASAITSGTIDTARLGSGSASASTYLRGDQTWAAVSSGGGFAIFGDGSDGTVTISGTTTLTRDMFYDVLTVQNGGVLNTANFRVFCRTSCTVDAGGAIRCDGGNGTDSSRWGGSAAGTGSTYYGLSSSGASASVGASNGAAGGNQGTCLGGSGGAGGGAGAYTGGAGGVATAPVASLGGFRSLIQALQSKALSYGGTTQLTAGCGGGSGATNTQVGGGGGAGGGILVLAAKAITNNGSISADGGRGSNNSALANSGGGGGGGGGGVVFAIFDTYAGTDPTAAGGAAGTHAAGGGTDGSAGSAGTVIKLANA